MNVGDKFGRLTVIELVQDRKNPAAICLCECGNKTKTQRGSLRNGRAKSCGCLRLEKFVERAKAARRFSVEEAKARKNAATIAWQKENRERYNARLRSWAEKNREKIRGYTQKRKDAKREYDKAYRIMNIDRFRESKTINSHRRRVAIRSQLGHVDRDIRTKLMRKQRNRCACCRIDLRVSGAEIDHIVPISRGGLHGNGNLQLLCPDCNRSKGAKPAEVFMRERGFLL